MKIIFSRKGFDSGFGGVASPIMPDGSMMSLPIPGLSNTRYNHIKSPFTNDGDIGSIVTQLTKGKITGRMPAHFDPDLNSMNLDRKDGWLASLGQTGSAQGHLIGQKVDVGDIFVFFGWFRETDYKDEQLIYKPKTKDLHVMFGYLQVGEILPLGATPDKRKFLAQYPWLEGHPHLYGTRDENNTLYLASPTLVINGMDMGLSGGGTFDKYHEKLCLTAPNQSSRSLWKVPHWLKPPIDKQVLSYHADPKRWSQNEAGENLLQTVAKGQEFVTEVQDLESFHQWFHDLIPKPKPKMKL